ncbi:winged helix-turn-helix domain-containing protein [uncultured Methanomethylovorans sp.]|uniref:helix-turn-helix domain-containing protein n=1 Tax=uncultured Methanomethylovorans sp. TaxID=183759 RepID=UPI003747D470
MSEKEVLGKILELLVRIDKNLDHLVPKGIPMAHIQPIKGGAPSGLDVMTLLSLPEHLRTTATVLFESGPATAEEISKITKKERAVESGYLNQLVRMKHVNKYRDGRKVYFCINHDSKND